MELKKNTAKYFKNIEGSNDYTFYLDDSRNDFSRLLTTFKETGAFIISGCRSKFEGDTVEEIERQLKDYGVKYSKEEIESLKEANCDQASGIYNHLLDRYNATTTKRLEKELNSLGLGYRASYGGYKEKGQEFSNEFSFVVPYMDKYTPEEFLNIAVKLTGEYLQDSVFFTHPLYNNGTPAWVTKEGDIDATFEKDPKITGDEEYYTKTRKTHSPALTFVMKDAKSDILDEIVSKLSQYQMRVLRPSDSLRLTYDSYGWHTPKK